ncbi:transcriptional regulator, ArsR family [Variovorax paradoxus B4]|uniref:Transcriptional regulator, ArsR family n=2 Tax=Variovorax paradoxus TaxID=34073 RepID=T1XLR2_VARPD|nr:transcriptional regulator, ArsR family [Variovorax paradoxus B4]
MIAPDQHQACPSMEGLSDDALVQVAAYFQALAEPTRLQILNFLRQQERNVGELAQLCGYSSANISRHLALLTQHGLVSRQARGNSAYYRIADPAVYELCDLVCGNIARQLERTAPKRAAFAGPAVRRARPRPSPVRASSSTKRG